MRVLYNIIQFIVLILAGPFVLVKAGFTAKYRGRIAKRLGFGLSKEVACDHQSPRIWIHALSLGESISAQGLIHSLKQNFPDVTLLFSSASRAGEEYAFNNFRQTVDQLIPFPFDTPWAVKRLLDYGRPDLFILVETDFWPNFLFELKARGIPALLVNGRISDTSWKWYRRGSWLFDLVFKSFAFLCMQTEEDGKRMISLGIEPEKVRPLGNLKYEGFSTSVDSSGNKIVAADLKIPEDCKILVAGSTHEGEEEIIFGVFKDLLTLHPRLFLVLAPRLIERATALEKMAEKAGLSACRRTSVERSGIQVLILDTLGELSRVYGLADIAFVGGSLISQRGHNPLEPSGLGKPVLYGPHMEDFAEISQALQQAGAARQVSDAKEMFQVIDEWLTWPEEAGKAGSRGAALVKQNQGVIDRHIELIKQFIPKRESHDHDA